MFKIAKKGARAKSSEIFWASDLKVYNTDFHNVFVYWALLLLFLRKISSFWKKVQVFIDDCTILI